jgi:hypothetical protein
MANATTLAPLKKEFIEVEGLKVIKDSNEHRALLQEFDPLKKYVFQLAAENMHTEKPVIDAKTQRPLPHKRFKPLQNLIMTSQIVWNNGRIGIRYYDGCESIFVSQQPKEKDVIDQLIQSTRRRNFIEGKLVVDGYEKMLLLYLSICSWNSESNFKTTTSSAIFTPQNSDKLATAESDKLDMIEEAMTYAREATLTKMLIHSAFLGIPNTDYDSGNELTEKEIRTEYRKAASKNPKLFIESYGNKTLEVKYYIEKALVSGVISNKFNPNKATWGKGNTVICDISGLKSNDAIAQRLFEFSQTELGEEFAVQLKALNES